MCACVYVDWRWVSSNPHFFHSRGSVVVGFILATSDERELLHEWCDICDARMHLISPHTHFPPPLPAKPIFKVKNKLVYATPIQFNQSMTMHVKYHVGFSGNWHCSFERKNKRIFRLVDGYRFVHEYPDLSACTSYFCYYHTPYVSIVRRFGSACTISSMPLSESRWRWCCSYYYHDCVNSDLYNDQWLFPSFSECRFLVPES